jgi:hypothetical protein
MIRRGKVSIDYSREVGDDDHDDYKVEEFQISGNAYYDAGNYSGPYENSCPEEWDVSITQVLRRSASKWEKVSVDIFSEKEITEIEYLMLQDMLEGDDYRGPDNYRDQD